jgi:hypothetical protein
MNSRQSMEDGDYRGRFHTHPGCEDVSAVGIYPVSDEAAERNLVCPKS